MINQLMNDAMERRNRELRDLARALTIELKAAPVDPRLWIDGAAVKLIERDLNGECDGLIRFRGGRFYIFWDPRASRARFSLAHEVAHYLIPDHHHLLLTGKIEHASQAGFRSLNTLEREADTLAAQLLMPEHLFQELEPEFKHITKRAGEFDVSLTSCLVRTMQICTKAAAGILATNGEMRWCCSSEEMALSGMHNQSLRKVPPARSKTAEVLKDMAAFPREPVRSKIPLRASEWFQPSSYTEERFDNRLLWEELFPQANLKSVLTILIPD